MGMVKLYVRISAIDNQCEIDNRILAYKNPMVRRRYRSYQSACQHSTIFGGAL